MYECGLSFLSGDSIRLGTVTDVVDKVHGRYSFNLAVSDEIHNYAWSFSGERSDMSMSVDSVSVDGTVHEKPLALHHLIPNSLHDDDFSLAHRIKGLTYITAERVGPREFYSLEDRQVATVVGPSGEHAVGVLHSGRDEIVLDRILHHAPIVRIFALIHC